MGRLFGTDGIRGQVNKHPMEPELILRIGLAAGSYFRKHGRGGAASRRQLSARIHACPAIFLKPR